MCMQQVVKCQKANPLHFRKDNSSPGLGSQNEGVFSAGWTLKIKRKHHATFSLKKVSASLSEGSHEVEGSRQGLSLTPSDSQGFATSDGHGMP